MKKHILLTAVFAFFAVPTAFATEITNLSATPSGITLLIQWDSLTATDLSNVEGYALQWGTDQSNVRIDKQYRQTTPTNQNTLSVRSGDFEKNRDYFFRVYTYTKDGRSYKLANGSKILKWKWDALGNVTSELIAASDPVISSTSDSEATVDSFGELGIISYDKSARFQWSRPNLPSSSFESFKLIVSTASDLSSPLIEATLPRTTSLAYLEGLTPETVYYAAGAFYKDGSKFGQGTTKSFKTTKAFDTKQQQAFERALKRLQTSTGLGTKLKIGDSSTTTDTTTSSSTTTSSTSTSSTTTSTATAAELSPVSGKTYTQKETQARIDVLETALAKWKTVLRNLKLKKK